MPQASAPFNWGDQYLSETHPAVDACIAIMEIDLLREFETIMGCPLVPNPFWSTRILLARDIQAKIQTAQGIREAMETIRRGKQESVTIFRLLDQIAQNMLANLEAAPENLGVTPVNSPTMQPLREEF